MILCSLASLNIQPSCDDCKIHCKMTTQLEIRNKCCVAFASTPFTFIESKMNQTKSGHRNFDGAINETIKRLKSCLISRGPHSWVKNTIRSKQPWWGHLPFLSLKCIIIFWKEHSRSKSTTPPTEAAAAAFPSLACGAGRWNYLFKNIHTSFDCAWEIPHLRQHLSN